MSLKNHYLKLLNGGKALSCRRTCSIENQKSKKLFKNTSLRSHEKRCFSTMFFTVFNIGDRLDRFIEVSNIFSLDNLLQAKSFYLITGLKIVAVHSIHAGIRSENSENIKQNQNENLRQK